MRAFSAEGALKDVSASGHDRSTIYASIQAGLQSNAFDG